MILGREVCPVPSERWQHGAAMFNDSTMLIYGGFSQRCEDYCNDLWSYDFRPPAELGGSPGGWMELIEIDDARYGRGETPGRRWKFSVVSDGEMMLIFGGFRSWQAHGAERDEDDEFGRDPGGYLHDLWSYRKLLLTEKQARSPYGASCGWYETGSTIGVCGNTAECHLDGSCCPLRVPTQSRGLAYGLGEGRDYGIFQELLPKIDSTVPDCSHESLCTDDSDSDVYTPWPAMRAGHVATLDVSSGHCRRRMWVHGGYTTYMGAMMKRSANARP